jgi:TonB family protein
VVDAHVVSGPDELRKAVIQSVLNWHFTSDSANGTRQVTVVFAIPQGPTPVRGAARIYPAPLSGQPPARILAITAPADLLARLPIHEGDMMTPELRASLEKTVHDYDEHFVIGSQYTQDGLRVIINPPNTRMSPPVMQTSSTAPAPGAVRVVANVAAANILSQTPPEYPPLAKAARVQGTVRFEATIGKDGAVQNLQLLEGPPLLVQAAMHAVRQWVYKPTLLNGQPVQAITTIDVNFTLSEN